MKTSGTAIHSGLTSTVVLHRESGPIRFRRAGRWVPANVHNVVGAARATSLGVDGARVHMVEHLLAALTVSGFYSGVVVDVDQDELPILDGSAAPWLPAIKELGPPPPAPAALTLRQPLEVHLGQSGARLTPGDTQLDYRIDFAHPAIGAQRITLAVVRWPELLDARTFGLLADWEVLKSSGLALGASEEHAIVFGDAGPLRPLRHADEPVRHKALDAVGDLALLTRPLVANVQVWRGSHALHHEVVRQLMRAGTREVHAS